MIGLRNLAVGLVSRVPARVQTKLLVAFLVMVALLFLLGAVGLRVLSGMNERTEELIELQRKITAYRHVQHDTTRQLYGVSSALLLPDEWVLDGILRQLSQFGYDLDRLQYVAQDEVELLAEVREDYDRFIAIVTDAVEQARAGQIEAARALQLREAAPLADRLERLTNQLVNVAESNMLERIEASQQAYDTSRIVVVGLVLGSIILALSLGYVFSWSIVGPLAQVAGRLRQVAAGEFTGRLDVVNRDELGALAADVNRTSEELGSLYQQIEQRTNELSEALEQQVATSGILRAIAASPTDILPVLDAVAESTAQLCEAHDAAIFLRRGDVLALAAHHGPISFDFGEWPIGRDWVTGRAVVDRRPVHVGDLLEQEDEFPAGREMARRIGHRTTLAIPLLRENDAIGALLIRRLEVRPFSSKQVELLKTFADQAVIAIENVRLFDEVQARTRALTEALEQQTATSEILRVISTSPTEVQPVFETIVRSAVALCGSLFANVFRFDGELIHFVASHNVDPNYVALLRGQIPDATRFFPGIRASRPHQVGGPTGERAGRSGLRSSVSRGHELAADAGCADAAPRRAGRRHRRRLGRGWTRAEGPGRVAQAVRGSGGHRD